MGMNENMQQYDVSAFEDAGIHWYTLVYLFWDLFSSPKSWYSGMPMKWRIQGQKGPLMVWAKEG